MKNAQQLTGFRQPIRSVTHTNTRNPTTKIVKINVIQINVFMNEEE